MSEHRCDPDGKADAQRILSLEMGDVHANAYVDVDHGEAVLVDIFHGYSVLVYYFDSIVASFQQFSKFLDTLVVLSLYESCEDTWIVISLGKVTLVVYESLVEDSTTRFAAFLMFLSYSAKVITADTQVSKYIYEKFGIQFDVNARETYQAAHRFSVLCRQYLFKNEKIHELLMVPYIDEDRPRISILLYSLVALALKGSYVFMIESKFYGFTEDYYTLEALKRNEYEHFSMDQFVNFGYLASGSYGLVELVFHIEYGQLFVIKWNSCFDSRALRCLSNERECLIKLKHPCIVHIFGEVVDKISCGLVLEFCPNNTSSLPECRIPDELSRRVWFASDLLFGVEYIILNGYLHRDLKLGNILIGYGDQLKISDFGSCSLVEDACKDLDRNVTPANMTYETRHRSFEYQSEVKMCWAVMKSLITGSFTGDVDSFIKNATTIGPVTTRDLVLAVSTEGNVEIVASSLVAMIRRFLDNVCLQYRYPVKRLEIIMKERDKFDEHPLIRHDIDFLCELIRHSTQSTHDGSDILRFPLVDITERSVSEAPLKQLIYLDPMSVWEMLRNDRDLARVARIGHTATSPFLYEHVIDCIISQPKRMTAHLSEQLERILKHAATRVSVNYGNEQKPNPMPIRFVLPCLLLQKFYVTYKDSKFVKESVRDIMALKDDAVYYTPDFFVHYAAVQSSFYDGVAALRSGMYQEAVDAFVKCIQHGDQSLREDAFLGAIKARLGNLDKAGYRQYFFGELPKLINQYHIDEVNSRRARSRCTFWAWKRNLISPEDCFATLASIPLEEPLDFGHMLHLLVVGKRCGYNMESIESYVSSLALFGRCLDNLKCPYVDSGSVKDLKMLTKMALKYKFISQA